MKHLLLLLMSFVVCISGIAQSVTVKGKVTDAKDKTGLPYATISVFRESAQKNAVRKLATDDKGNFSTSLSAGKYIFSFHFVGMNTATRQVEVKSNEINLGAIELRESATELGEISVTAQRPLVKVEIDKLSYSAKDDPEASTSNVLDLLRKVPMVTVDGNDNIQLKGSSSFKIYLNGKPSNMLSNNPSQVLKGMPANTIKNIEVITDPGAKYDAEGVGGIINIVTDKRVDDGYSGSVGANGDTFGGYGGNVFLTAKSGKFGFSGNASYFNHERPTAELYSYREETAPNPLNTLTQNGTQRSYGGGIILNATLSYEPDTLNLFTISTSRFGGKFTSNSSQHALSEGARAYSYDSKTKNIGEYGNFNLSTDYQRSFKKKGELLTISYRFENNPNDSEYESEYNNVKGVAFYYPDGYRQKSLNDAGGVEHTGQVDYVNPLNNKHSLETGLKYIFRNNTSKGEHTYLDVSDATWKSDVQRKNDLDHYQHILSGYAGYGYKNGKMGLKVGLRGEQTNQKIHFMSNKSDTTVNTRFFDLVPSITLSYQLGMTQTIRGGYNMRISRPGIWYLNPYVNDLNPTNISYGNSNLEAEQQHNFNINYGSFSQKLNYNVTLSYAFSENAVTNYSFVKDGITHNTYDNIGRNRILGLNTYASWSPSQRINMYVNGGLNYSTIQSTNDSGLKNSGFSGRGFGGITFTLPNDFRIGANAGIFSRPVQLQTVQSAFYFYSLNLQKSFLDKKLDVALNASNVFGKDVKLTSTTTGDGFMQKNTYHNPMRNLRLSVTYRFGELKSSIKKVQRTISNDDVKAGENNTQGGGAGGAS